MSRLLHAAVFGAATAGALTLGTGVAHADGTHHGAQPRHGEADEDADFADMDAEMNAEPASEWSDEAYDGRQAVAPARTAKAGKGTALSSASGRATTAAPRSRAARSSHAASQLHSFSTPTGASTFASAPSMRAASGPSGSISHSSSSGKHHRQDDSGYKGKHRAADEDSNNWDSRDSGLSDSQAGAISALADPSALSGGASSAKAAKASKASRGGEAGVAGAAAAAAAPAGQAAAGAAGAAGGPAGAAGGAGATQPPTGLVTGLLAGVGKAITPPLAGLGL